MDTIIFDLDGTLIESAPAIRNVANRLMDELGLRSLDMEEARSFVGDGAAAFLTYALKARGAWSKNAFEQHFARFQEIFDAASPNDNSPMRGAANTLGRLHAAGYRLGICTNKPQTPTRAILEALGWSQYFGAVVCGDTQKERKPHARPLVNAISQLGGQRAIFIGDSEVDAQTAEAARLPFVIYTRGYCRVPLEDLSYAATFDDFARLPGLIAGM